MLRKNIEKSPPFLRRDGGLSIKSKLGRAVIVRQVNGSGISAGFVGLTLPS